MTARASHTIAGARHACLGNGFSAWPRMSRGSCLPKTADCPWTNHERNRRRFTEATDARTLARTFLVNSRDDSVDIAWIAVRSANWTPIRMLRVCQVNRYADDHGNCQDTFEPSRQLLCRHSVDWRGAFPANCPDNARQLPGTSRTYSPEIAWMIRGTPTGLLRDLLRGLHRQLPGHS